MHFKITQDGAGFVGNSSEIDGFYTDKVESCIVYVIYGSAGTAIIHDTAQISIKSIVTS